MTHIAFALYCILLLGLVALWKSEHRPQTAPLVRTAEPASVVPWRLLTVCTPNRTNVPLYKEHEA